MPERSTLESLLFALREMEKRNDTPGAIRNEVAERALLNAIEMASAPPEARDHKLVYPESLALERAAEYSIREREFTRRQKVTLKPGAQPVEAQPSRRSRRTRFPASKRGHFADTAEMWEEEVRDWDDEGQAYEVRLFEQGEASDEPRELCFD